MRVIDDGSSGIWPSDQGIPASELANSNPPSRPDIRPRISLTPTGYLSALEDLGALWAGEPEHIDGRVLAAQVSAEETGLVNVLGGGAQPEDPRPDDEDSRFDTLAEEAEYYYEARRETWD